VKFNAEVFRQYDIRGRADVDLTDDFVTALGRAYGTHIRRRGGRRVVLGRDCRQSGPRLVEAFRAGVLAAGVDVTEIGVIPTPLMYFALYHWKPDGGVVITGSHNPPNWNGFKMCEGTAAMYGDGLLALRDLIAAGDFESGSGSAESRDIVSPYLDVVAGNIQLGPRRFKVVVDAGNGMGGIVAIPLYKRLGFDVVDLYCEPDGRFPNHHPDPTVEANLADLKKAVAEHGAAVGLAFDGDADRLGAVDDRGRVAWGDQLLTFFARGVLAENPGASIVGEVKCSKVLYDDVAKHGGKPDMWKVGHSLIKARLRETGAKLAGEMSGHIFFNDRWYGFDDAVYAGARLLELLTRTDETLADMLDGLPPTLTTPELRVHCPDAAKFAVVTRAADHFRARYPVFDLDGVRITFPTGWGLVRPSNTQPVLVLRFEADTEANLAAYRGEVESWLRECAPEVDLDAPTDH
jgi:phosphomannomutase/phosphoglucomutase